MGPALREIDGPETKMAFPASRLQSSREVVLSFCLPGSQRVGVEKALDAHAPHAARSVQEAAGIFFHGPHFGDRYRIAGTLTDCMKPRGYNPWP